MRKYNQPALLKQSIKREFLSLAGCLLRLFQRLKKYYKKTTRRNLTSSYFCHNSGNRFNWHRHNVGRSRTFELSRQSSLPPRSCKINPIAVSQRALFISVAIS